MIFSSKNFRRLNINPKGCVFCARSEKQKRSFCFSLARLKINKEIFLLSQTRVKKIMPAVFICLSVCAVLAFYFNNMVLWLVAGLLALALLILAILFIQIRLYNIFLSWLDLTYRQIEALFSLFALIKIKSVLPPMRGWTLSPDAAVLLVSEILTRRPKVIVDLGSGVSTLLSAYALKKIGGGKVISFDHNEEFLSLTRQQILQHNLQDFVELLLAPLKEIKIKEEVYPYYSLQHFDKIDQVDLLIVDGPPLKLHKLSRYPALPLFHKKLTKDAIIFIDDGHRSEVKEMLGRWLQEFDDTEKQSTNTEKEVVILRKKKCSSKK